MEQESPSSWSTIRLDVGNYKRITLGVLNCCHIEGCLWGPRRDWLCLVMNPRQMLQPHGSWKQARTLCFGAQWDLRLLAYCLGRGKTLVSLGSTRPGPKAGLGSWWQPALSGPRGCGQPAEVGSISLSQNLCGSGLLYRWGLQSIRYNTDVEHPGLPSGEPNYPALVLLCCHFFEPFWLKQESVKP